ncbi:MAG: hypothetical protein IKP88_01315 [Lachnospiraceae bacterium]|nr:hypothetical protein [Lachnospiraceae bacterium]
MFQEIAILLGIKPSKQNEIKTFKNENNFLKNITDILNSENSNKILTEIPNNHFQNNMLINFVETVGLVENFGEFEINVNNSNIKSDFFNGIKHVDNINHKANLKFSDEFKNKINEFELPKETEKVSIDASKFNAKNKKEKADTDDKDNDEIESVDDKEYVTFEANSMDELLSKVRTYTYNSASSRVMTDSEKMLGTQVDYKG